ncbi:hypothetical protein MNBD_NITROSPINAE03-1149 [hydrothermal vent metagenome]|uniref:Response regulatory domain-containing protein n=1 Tax=hydrothermal vent metagenome TaxID=652676 RepID=A0A3B1CBN5_9ZZZZ
MRALDSLVVLVVDDAPNMRRTLKGMLRSIGVSEVVEAVDGENAWELLNTVNIDFIISDWHMPKLPGLELLRRVRDKPSLRNIPFLIVSGEASETRIAQAAETEVDGCLLKPFMARTLEEKIKYIVYKTDHPSLFEKRIKTGLIMIEQNMYDEALVEFGEALNLKPDSARARHALGEVCMLMGEADKAEQWLLEAASINPQYIRVHEGLGELYKKKGKEDVALVYLERAAEISPHNADRQMALGKIYVDQGETEKAEGAFKTALESGPDTAGLHTEIGEIYLASGDASKAANSFKSSLNISQSVHVYNRLGIALRRKKRFPEAIEEYYKALKVDPNDEAVYYNIGRAYIDMKEYNKARDALKQALKLDPGFEESAELLSQLEKVAGKG